VAGSADLIDFLRNRAASWIYTTGLSPADTAAALAALRIGQAEPDRRDRLWQNVARLKGQLQQWLGSLPGNQAINHLLPSDSPILCVQGPDPATIVDMGRSLRDAGILAGAIRPPTVPTSRLRFTVMATHEPAQLDRLVIALDQAVGDRAGR